MGAPERLLARVLHVMALAAGWVLLALTLYTVVDVTLRYVFNAPFRGSLETTQFAMALIVFLALGHCGWTGGHIVVDLFDRLANHPRLRLVPAIVAFLGSGLMWVVAWQTTVETVATLDRASNMMRMPYYPFRFVAAFGAAMFALALLVQGVRALPRRGG